MYSRKSYRSSIRNQKIGAKDFLNPEGFHHPKVDMGYTCPKCKHYVHLPKMCHASECHCFGEGNAS